MGKTTTRKADQTVGNGDRRQMARVRCECGVWARVQRAHGPWDFTWTCPHCKRDGTISWAHNQPPPYFEEMLTLPFDESEHHS
jgi:hypothetical protein